ncbi:hypothetical protein SBA6_210046 [Candidatus Sulfopaludibacter sp. SbA6]|nr:hypothetical protein SBA6_210046 [Candidatus Sulfopaludibacter sp. SbA6]
MNQNGMDRYFWRTGQRWSGDDRPFKTHTAGRRRANRMLLFLYAALAVIVGLRLLLRLLLR